MFRFRRYLLLLIAMVWGMAAGPRAAARAATAQVEGTIRVQVDARQAPERIVHSTEDIPVTAGDLTLYYPKWIPGEHEPSGPIASLTGLKFMANGQTIYWQRDLLDAWTFHLTVPQGATHLIATFDFLESGGGFATAAASATEKLVDINWNQNLLYPAGTPAQQLTYEASLQLPAGWKFGTPLPIARVNGSEVVFQPTALNRLVDSPVIAGQYYRAIDLTPPGEPIHHEIDLVADSPDALAMSPEAQKGMTRLVAEAGKFFGSRHYRDYHFLVTLSDHVAHFGLEHHECDDSRLPEDTLLSPDAGRALGGLLAHEYAHSWNGKFRRPADLSTPYYEAPEETDLLWVYEGLTEFAGPLLATRAGLWTPDEYRQQLAGISAAMGPGRPGRTWRPLIDTATGEPVLGESGRGGWGSWRRGTDYYPEGELLWLEVASIIHRESHGTKEIDDFCHLFHGGPNNGPELKPYTYQDLVNALNQVVPYDWDHFLQERLTSTSPNPPVGGIENSGWKFELTAQPSPAMGRRGGFGSLGLGLQLMPDGTVADSLVGSPAYEAGITSGMKVVGVNGRVFTLDRLTQAVDDAKGNQQPIELLVVNDDYYKTCAVNYHGGRLYPHLERNDSQPDYLDELVKPRAGQ